MSLAGPPWQEDAPEALDYSYQARLESMTSVRLSVAEAAMMTRRVRSQIAELESLQERLRKQRQRALETDRQDAAGEAEHELTATEEQLAGLKRLLPSVIEAEQKITKDSQDLQARIDAFRTRKETLKATHTAARAEYVAARAELSVHEAIATFGQDTGDPASQDEDLEAAVAAAAQRLQEITRKIEHELRTEPSAADLSDLLPAPGLMELRPGAPDDRDIRIIFAVEPPGTALLLAVLDGPEAVRDHHSEAVGLSSALLRQVRTGKAPDAAAYALDDPESFLDEFFPGGASEIAVGAAALVARNRARTLAEQRARLGLTQAQVAARMGVRQERVSAIERAEPGATEVRTLAGYVEALGGRLEIIADFGGERVVLR